MTNLQRVVDEIRFLLQREAIEHTDELTGLLSAYSRHCHEVNLRLRQCGERVKQGLLSEALHLAEASPNLMDAVAVLAFPELEQFLDVICLYSLPPPEPLMLDVAGALNEAYAQHQPLQKLLDLHRLLAMARAPLPQRLVVLRSLAELDATSPHWEIDILQLERVRVQELVSAARLAAKQGRVAELKALIAEVESQEWYEKVPTEVAREVKSLANQVHRGGARQRIEELSDELFAAFSELNATKARTLREEWNRNIKSAQIATNHLSVDRVAPVFDWLEDEDRKLEAERAYNQIVSEIERALENDHLKATDLKRMGRVVDRLERGLSESLESRYLNRLATLELSEARRKRLILGGSVTAVFAVLGIFGFFVYWSHKAEETRRLAFAISELIDEGKLSEARELADQKAPDAGSEAWISMQKKLVDAEHAERDRLKRFRNEIETAQQSRESARVEASLKLAREIARTTDEKIELGKVQSRWQQRVREEVATRDQAFRSLVESASQLIKTIDSSLVHEEEAKVGERQDSLNQAEKLMGRLRESRADVSAELAVQADLLDSRLAASKKTIADFTWRSSKLTAMTNALLIVPGDSLASSKVESFETGLREYATRLPNDPWTASFKIVAELRPLAPVMARQRLIDRWKRLRPQSEKDVAVRLREINDFLTEYPASADRELLKKYETWLGSIQRRFSEEGDPDEGILRKMAVLFGRPFIKDGNVLRDIDGKTYYLKASQDFTGKTGKQPVSFEYLIGFSNELRKSKDVTADKLATSATAPPPQAEIAAKVKVSIRDAGLENWREYFLTLSESLLSANRIDPFLRYLLVMKTLEYASAGDLFLEEELAAALDILNDDDVDRSVAWMDPMNEAADKARKRAAELLLRLPSLEAMFTKAGERQADFERELFKVRFPVGWLDKSAQGEWRCRTEWKPPNQHELFVAIRVDSTAPTTWVAVGQGDGKSLQIDAVTARLAGHAAVVFASPSSKDASTAQLP